MLDFSEGHFHIFTKFLYLKSCTNPVFGGLKQKQYAKPSHEKA